MHIQNLNGAIRIQKKIKIAKYDEFLGLMVLSLLLFGLVMVYSVSVVLPYSPQYANYYVSHFLIRHTIFIGLSLITAYIIFHIQIQSWKKLAPYFFICALVMLTLTLIPVGISKSVNGAHRWLSFQVFNFQPSELMKLSIILYVSDYTTRKQTVIHKLIQGFMPIIFVTSIVSLLLLLEPDLGACGVIVCVVMGILFVGGIDIIWFSLFGVLLIFIFTAIILLSWRRERIFSYLNPWSEINILGKAYQLSHALIAFGRGGLFGVGLGCSVEKLSYLPEAHTDFLFAIIGEELGFVGVLGTILSFCALVMRAFEIGRKACALNFMFSGLVAQGIAVWIGVQAFVNIGVNLGLLPTKGLTLPLMSYGGSGMLINCVSLAILLRIDYENRVLLRKYTEINHAC